MLFQFEYKLKFLILANYCTNGKIFSNCSNSCDTWCPVLTCTEQCHKPDTCKSGCICPVGLVENEDKQCVKPNECICKYNNNEVAPGQIIETDCESWYLF